MEKQVIKEQLLVFRPKTSLVLISSGQVVNIGFNEIAHIRKFGNVVVIYTDIREYRTRYSLQDMLNDLPVNEFLRVHKSHIVCLLKVTGVEKNRIRVAEYWLPFTSYYRAQMIRHLHLLEDKKQYQELLNLIEL